MSKGYTVRKTMERKYSIGSLSQVLGNISFGNFTYTNGNVKVKIYKDHIVDFISVNYPDFYWYLLEKTAPKNLDTLLAEILNDIEQGKDIAIDVRIDGVKSALILLVNFYIEHSFTNMPIFSRVKRNENDEKTN